MNRIGQRALPVALVGAGLPALPRQLRAAKPYAERMFAYHELDRLSEAEARLALLAPAAQLSLPGLPCDAHLTGGREPDADLAGRAGKRTRG